MNRAGKFREFYDEEYSIGNQYNHEFDEDQDDLHFH